jgi:single-strand DNA-binding protein
MGTVNNCTIVGRLGNDPDVHTFDDGQKVVNLSVATNAEWKDRNGEKKEETTWHRVVVRGPAADACANYLQKGREVAVSGEYRSRKYEVDGQERTAFELRARNVTFLGAKSDDAPAEVAPRQSAPEAGENLPF